MINYELSGAKMVVGLATLAVAVGQNALSNSIDAAVGAPMPVAKTTSETAHASSNKWCRNSLGVTPNNTICRWVVASSVDVPGERLHKWHFCTGSAPSPVPRELVCTIEKGKSHTVSADITGSHPVGIGELSVEAHYDVSAETSVSGSQGAHLKKNQGGEAYWAGRFGNFKDIYQKYIMCTLPPKGGAARCRDTSRPQKVAHTEKYLGVDFDFRKYKKPRQ